MAAILLVSHEVKEFDSWKKGFDGDASNRTAAGLEFLFLARDAAKPNLIHIGFKASSTEAAGAFVSNPRLRETMEKLGVVGMPDIRMGNI